MGTHETPDLLRTLRKESAQRGREHDAADPVRAKKAAEAAARRKRLRREQLADVVRLVAAQLADGRSVEDVAEVLLAADVRVYGDVPAGQTASEVDVQ